MTVSSTSFQTDWYEGDGANKTWPFAFSLFDTDMTVIQVTPDPDNSETITEYTSNFTITHANKAKSAGNVTYPVTGDALDADMFIRIVRRTPMQQLTEIGREGSFSPKIHERALDRLTMMAQELDKKIDDAVMETAEDLNAAYVLPPFVGAAPTLLLHMLDEDVNLWMFRAGNSQIELGPTGDPDLNSEIVDKAFNAAKYDPNRIRGVKFPHGLLRLNNGQHEVPNGVRAKGQFAVLRLDRIATVIQGVGPGDTFRIGGDVDAASGQHYFNGEISGFRFMGDDTQPYGNEQPYGDSISFLTLGGDDVAPQDSSFVGNNMFRHPPRHAIYLPRGALPLTWSRNYVREAGGSGYYMDAGFNIQSCHFHDFSGDSCLGGLFYFKNLVDTGNVLLTNVKSEMNYNKHYGVTGTEEDPIYLIAQQKCIIIKDSEKGVDFHVNGGTHISAVVEDGVRRRQGDFITTEGSEVPAASWKDLRLRLKFGSGIPDDPGDPEAFYCRTPWTTYRKGTDFIPQGGKTSGHQIHDDEGYDYFGELARYFNKSVENTGRQINGVTPMWSLYETDGAANNRSGGWKLSGGSMQMGFTNDAVYDADEELVTPATFSNLWSANQTDGVARNWLSEVPFRLSPLYTKAAGPNQLPTAAGRPLCCAIISDPAIGKPPTVISWETSPAVWQWVYTTDLTVV